MREGNWARATSMKIKRKGKQSVWRNKNNIKSNKPKRECMREREGEIKVTNFEKIFEIWDLTVSIPWLLHCGKKTARYSPSSSLLLHSNRFGKNRRKSREKRKCKFSTIISSAKYKHTVWSTQTLTHTYSNTLTVKMTKYDAVWFAFKCSLLFHGRYIEMLPSLLLLLFACPKQWLHQIGFSKLHSYISIRILSHIHNLTSLRKAQNKKEAEEMTERIIVQNMPMLHNVKRLVLGVKSEKMHKERYINRNDKLS